MKLFKSSIIISLSIFVLSPLINFTGLTKQQVQKVVSNQQMIKKDIKKNWRRIKFLQK